MSTAVHRIEVADGVPDLYVSDGYTGLMILVTFRGVPLGDIRIKAHHGMVSSGYLANRIAQDFCSRLVQLWLEEKMNCDDTGAGAGMLPSIDAIVCTCDRPADLRRCLQSLNETSYVGKTIIVVDNGLQCRATYEVAQRYGARYVRERKRGLDFARNAGLEAGESDLVAFADDDVVVDPMWLGSIAGAFRSDEAIACVTGLTMPFELETEAQEMFESYCDGGLRRGYGRWVYDRSNVLPAAAGRVGAGANMAFRAAVLREIGGFDEALDCGTPAKAGGDSDMFYRVIRRGYKICYEPRALAWHRHRRGMDELRSQLAGYSTAVYAFLTKCVLEYRDFDALSVGYSWFKGRHFKNLLLGIVGRGPQPWRMSVVEAKGALQGPIAYLRAKSYVSHLRLQEGSERRGRLNRQGKAPVGTSNFAHRTSALLAHLAGSGRRRRSAERDHTHP